uniref:MULE transposase domain-containing protein n=1 Tax=Globisporangium ultimum (strain ATCC 200006 / CBS 805.95 / DAOM BR144) TaxID=431595 RepID=K3WNU4_GLOUD
MHFIEKWFKMDYYNLKYQVFYDLSALTMIPVSEIKEKGIRYCQFIVVESGSKGKWDGFWRFFRKMRMEQYDTSLWNVNAMMESSVDIVNRTDNPLEKYNRDFSDKFTSHYPHLLTFVEVAKAEAIRYVSFLEDIKRDQQRPPQHTGVINAVLPESHLQFE